MTAKPSRRESDYGKELILDLHSCNPLLFTHYKINKYFKELCVLIDMEACKVTWWDDLHTPDAEKQTLPHTTGTSAVQFILTSSIVIHTLDILERAYINVFSCKDFDEELAKQFTVKYFKGEIVAWHCITRV